MSYFHSAVIRKGALIFAACSVLVSCFDLGGDSSRPNKVPKAASRTHGVDGDVWILCKSAKNGDQCTVYSGSTGKIILTGTYVDGVNSQGFAGEGPNYAYFSGESILLADGRVLDRVQSQSKGKPGNGGHQHRKKRA